MGLGMEVAMMAQGRAQAQRWNRPIAVMLTACLSGFAQAQTSGTPEPGKLYEVRYRHWVQNPTNDTLYNVRVFLPIPQSDCGQDVQDWQLMPGSEKYDVELVGDQFGQRVATIRIPSLAPGAEVETGFDCSVSLRAAGCRAVDAGSVEQLTHVPASIRRLYTRDDEQTFDLRSQIIRETAARLLAEHPDPIDRAEAIARFVADRLEYVRDNRWDAASVVLRRRTGSCSEFSFVFCALCRATGIPTRFVGGSMYGDGRIMPYEDTVWHRWSQVYLPGQGWVDVDPTLGTVSGRQTQLGRRHPRVLALTYSGSHSDVLGLAYIGANSHHRTLQRRRNFTWTCGTWEQFCRGRALEDNHMPIQAEAAYRDLIRRFGTTRAADSARQRLASLGRQETFARQVGLPIEPACEVWIQQARESCMDGNEEEARLHYAHIIRSFPASECARTALEEAAGYGLFQ